MFRAFVSLVALGLVLLFLWAVFHDLAVVTALH